MVISSLARGAALKRLTWLLCAVVTLATVALCMANFDLIKFVVIGLLLGGVLWSRIPLAVRAILGILAIAVLLAGCSSQTTVYQWPASYQAQVNLNPAGTIWTVRESVTIAAATLRQITEGTGQYSATLPAPKPGQYQLDTEKLERVLKAQGWQLTAVINGDMPEFSLRARTIRRAIPVVPLVASHSVPLVQVSLPAGVVLTPATGSLVTITSPAGVIAATTPPSSALPTTTGEQRVASWPETSGSTASNVSISTLSVLARDQPVRSLAGLSLQSGTSAAVAVVWMALIAAFQGVLRDGGAAAWKRLRNRKKKPEDATAQQDADKERYVGAHKEWTEDDFRSVIAQGAACPLALLDLCSQAPGTWVTSTDIYAHAGVSAASGAGQIASFSRSVRSRFGRDNQPWEMELPAKGARRNAYKMDEATASHWLAARASAAAVSQDDADAER